MRFTPLLFSLAACALPGLASATSNAPSLLVPAYFYPEAAGATEWARLTAAASQVSVTAIINPDSGAGSAYDPTYAQAVIDFKSAGGKVLGYVSTNWGQRDLQAVKSDIDNYANWYPVDGLFFDESGENASELGYFTTVANYARQSKPGATLIANPGTVPNEAYMALFNSVVVYENPASKLSAYVPPAYLTKYSADHFGMLVLNGSQAVMEQQVAFAASNNLGYVYVNDRPVRANEWGALPAYWDAEVAAVKLLSAVPEPEQYAMLLAGLGLVAGAARRQRAKKHG